MAKGAAGAIIITCRTGVGKGRCKVGSHHLQKGGGNGWLLRHLQYSPLGPNVLLLAILMPRVQQIFAADPANRLLVEQPSWPHASHRWSQHVKA